jgi:hypothetical protein
VIHPVQPNPTRPDCCVLFVVADGKSPPPAYYTCIPFSIHSFDCCFHCSGSETPFVRDSLPHCHVAVRARVGCDPSCFQLPPVAWYAKLEQWTLATRLLAKENRSAATAEARSRESVDRRFETIPTGRAPFHDTVSLRTLRREQWRRTNCMANSAATAENNISIIQNSVCTVIQTVLLVRSRCGEGHTYRTLQVRP